MTAPPQLHELEAEIMDEMWGRGEATVRDVQQALNARGGKVRAYTTLLTVMTRLDAKALLLRRRAGRFDVYAPVMSREEYLQARAEAEVAAYSSGEAGEVTVACFATAISAVLSPAITVTTTWPGCVWTGVCAPGAKSSTCKARSYSPAGMTAGVRYW